MPVHRAPVLSTSDASHLNGYKISAEEKTSLSDNGSMDDIPGPMTRERISSLTGRTKAKTKKLSSSDNIDADEQTQDTQEDPLDILKADSAFSSSRLIKKRRFRPAKTADKMFGAIQSLGNAVVHPVKSVKRTATRTTASQLSKAERPFLSQKADIEFLQAHDNLKRAESTTTSSSKRGTSDEEHDSLIDGHRDRVREMEEHRESLRAAWTTSRHVVRVVSQRHIIFPEDEYFVERDEHGDFIRYEWLKWLGYVIMQPSGFQAGLLTSRYRTLFTIRKGLALSTLTTLKSSPMILIAQDVTLND